jgi:hypothetical protein
MRQGKLIALFVLVLLVAVTAGVFTAQRWIKTTFRHSQPVAGAEEIAPRKKAGTLPISSPPIVIMGATMARAFHDGRLPSPLPQPQGTPEQAAAELAKRVINEDDQSTAALLTALQMSGFSVRGDDGTMALEAVRPGQGIVMDAWEAASLAKLFGDGMQTKLSDLSNSFATTVPSLQGAPVANLFLDGIRGAAQSSQPSMRFWADFIAEMGRQSATPYDLLSSGLDPGKVDLDAIQVSLILRRLVADVMIREGSKTHKAEFAPAWERDSTSPRWKAVSYQFEGGNIRDAVWRPGHGPHLLLAQEGKGGGSSLPCTMTDLQSQIMDINAYLSAKAFDSMLEYMGEHGFEGAEEYGKATGFANAALALIKLLAYYGCIETDITMSGEPPLVRTQAMYADGERRTLTGTVRANIKNWQALNCARLALNGANLDISLPSDGPMAGVQAQWQLTNDGFSISGEPSNAFVALLSPDGTPRIQSATGPVSNATAPKTDEEGHITIDIYGLRQREKLTDPVPVMKEAEVRFSVSAKAISLGQDAIDIGGNALGGLAGTLIGGPVEMLLRSQLHLSKRLLIPVKDWDSGDGKWSGRIQCSKIYAGDEGQNDLQTWSNSEAVRISYDIQHNSGFVYGFAESKFVGINKQKALRGGAITLIDDTSTVGEGSASDTSPATLEVDVDEARQAYSINPGAAFSMQPGKMHTVTCIKGSCRSEVTDYGVMPCLKGMVGGKLADPDHLKGSQTEVKTGLGRGRNGTFTYTVTWDLTRSGVHEPGT